MNNKAIGVFDSGLGGLTAVRELMEVLPGEDIVYFGDTGRVPYGSRSEETIIKYTMQDIRFLKSFDIKIIICACGTASSVALPHIQSEIPVIGVVESAVQAAAKATKTGRIGIIGTEGTIRSGAYEKLLHNAGLHAQSVSCPMFVPLVENGYAQSEAARLIARDYLSQFNEADTLILGCTHYPLLKKIIGEIMGDGVTLIDSGAECARRVQGFLTDSGQQCREGKMPVYRYYVSDSVENFSRLGGLFLNRDIQGHVEKVDIERF